MPTWITTKYHHVVIEVDYDKGESKNRKFEKGVQENHQWDINWQDYLSELENLIKLCNEQQYEIKGIYPLSKSYAETYAHAAKDYSTGFGNNGNAYGWGWGLGHGFGVPIGQGFTAILQKNESISEEEYSRRIQEVSRLQNLNNEIVSLQNNIAEVERKDAELNDDLQRLIETSGDGIKENKSILGGVTFTVGKEKFKDKQEAELFYKSHKEKIEKIKLTREELKETLKGLKERLTELQAQV